MKENTLCGYCEYQSSCPLREWKYKSEGEFTPEEQEIQPLIDEYATLSKEISANKKQADQNKNLIVEYMKSHQLKDLEIDNILLKCSPRKGINFPDITVLEKYLHENKLRSEASSVNRYTIASLIKE